MRLFALILCLSFVSLGCSSDHQSTGMLVAANRSDESICLFRIFQNGKFGFIDRSGKVIIEPQFNWVEDFSEGLALVSANGTKGFIDMAGKWVLVPKDVDVINGFSNGFARGHINTAPYSKGYIDKSGKLVIDTKAGGACDFSEGLACVLTNKWGFIDTSGRYVIEPQFDEVSYFSEGFAAVKFWDQSKAAQT